MLILSNIFPLVFIGFIILLMDQNILTPWPGFLYIATSGFAFVIYGWDKQAAIHHKSRIPEKHLHLLSIIGGWPGAMLGQNLFRHKTSKQPFRFIFHLCWLVNLVILAAFFQARWQPYLTQIMNQFG